MEKWARVRYAPCIPLGKDGKNVTGSQAHIDVSRRIAAEGMVLLKNQGNLLPLKDNKKIVIFGKGQYDYVKGGGGSGYVFTKYTRNIYEGLKIKEAEHKIEVFDGLYDFYKNEVEKQYADLRANGNRYVEGFTTEPEIPEALLIKAKNFTDTAIITICRFSGEEYDRRGEEYDGYFYLSREEEKMVNTVTENFKNVIVIINAGAQTDSEWYHENNKISSVLYAWQSGIEGGLAIADVLCGEWGYKGMVTSDWWNTAEPYKEIKAGNDIKMPFSDHDSIMKALADGKITRPEIEVCAKRVLEMIMKID